MTRAVLPWNLCAKPKQAEDTAINKMPDPKTSLPLFVSISVLPAHGDTIVTATAYAAKITPIQMVDTPIWASKIGRKGQLSPYKVFDRNNTLHKMP